MRNKALLFLLVFGMFFISRSVDAQELPTEIELKEIAYKSWVYPNISGVGKSDLRTLAQGKKLLLVVYFAPWCPDWNSEISFLKDLMEKYEKEGLGIVAIGEYDSPENMKLHFERKGIRFPGVWETDSLGSQRTSEHYRYRTLTGDVRLWGTPWHIFLEPNNFPESGDVLTEKAWIANGKVIKEQAEPFIRQRLGLDDK